MQRLPDGVANNFFFPAQTAIPKPQDFDSTGFKKVIAFGISRAVIRSAVLAAIKFDVEVCLQTEEIQNERAIGMLSPKFIF